MYVLEFLSGLTEIEMIKEQSSSNTGQNFNISLPNEISSLNKLFFIKI